MAIDRNRGAFVKEEYRFEIDEATEVKAVQGQARVIEIKTNLDMTAAATLAREIMDEQKHVSQAYSVSFEGIDIIGPSDFIGSPPTFLCNFPDWPVELTHKLRTLSVEVNGETMTTTVLLKGAIT